ncbi:MAG: EI24 domain-containing protein [Desulfatibacillum sp.]|nr:EI24 domain-containing protein [Desulfatibacillum sp.]
MFPFAKTFASVKKAGLYWLMLACAALAISVVFGAVAVITWFTDWLVHFQAAWINWLITGTVGVATGIGGWFMLPALTVLIGGVFQETAIDRVERIYYPDQVRQGGPRFWPDIIHDIKFTAWAIFLNMLILPFYLLGIGFAMSVALNTYLLGREFFESAAGYHLGKPRAMRLESKNKLAVYGGGFVMTLLTLTPLINLFVPIIAVVWMIHVYHTVNPEGAPAAPPPHGEA